MTMYVTKVWGFDIPCGPLVFSTSGWRANAATQLKPGDLVINVGTKGENTEEGDRNRVLGMMEPSTIAVATSDFIVPDRSDPRIFTADGAYRWPFGLLNRRAWEFAPGLFLDDVAPREGNRFGSQAAAGIVPLTAEEEARVLAHPHSEIPLLSSMNADRKLYGEAGARRRGAPTPAEGVRRGSMHMRRARACVYWFRLVSAGKVKGHKIGWAFDAHQRQRQFNGVSLSALGGLEYKLFRHQFFNTARIAFHVEQRLLTLLDDRRHSDNREVVVRIQTEDLGAIWDREIQAALLGERAA